VLPKSSVPLDVTAVSPALAHTSAKDNCQEPVGIFVEITNCFSS